MVKSNSTKLIWQNLLLYGHIPLFVFLQSESLLYCISGSYTAKSEQVLDQSTFWALEPSLQGNNPTSLTKLHASHSISVTSIG